MAKVGFWLKGAQGKFAGATIYKGKGGTQIREIVAPSNPRTQRQMSRRASFLCPVKFFARAKQNFFPFAFESKKPEWSEFNAFMHFNANNGVYMSQAAASTPSYPCIGKWQMTQGSLPTPTIGVIQGDRNGFNLSRDGNPGTANIANLSKSLLADYPEINVGDIVTFVAITVKKQYNYPELNPDNDPTKPIVWDIAQCIIDPDNTAPLPAMSAVTAIQSSPVGYVFFTESDQCAFTVVVSRNTSNGLRVSSSILHLSPKLEKAWEASRSDAYRQQVLDSWGAKSPAILQGALASDGEVVPVEGTMSSFSFQNTYFAKAPVYDSDLQYVKITGNNGYLVMADDTILSLGGSATINGQYFECSAEGTEGVKITAMTGPGGGPKNLTTDFECRYLVYEGKKYLGSDDE